MKLNKTTQLNKWLPAFVASAALAGSNLLSAQTWEALLPSPDFAPGYTGMSALIDPFSDTDNPGVFIGSATDGLGNGSIVRLDPNGTSSYNVTVVDSELLAVYELGYNPHPSSGAIYAVGIRRKVTVPPLPQNNPFIWTVRKSSTGDTWETDNTFYLSSKENAMASGFAADADGNVYVCGTATLKNVYHWIVRKLPAPSVSEPTPAWRTVSDLNVKWAAEANEMCFFPGNSSLNLKPAVFAVGVIGGKWEVRRSQDQGANWVSVDSLPLTSRARGAGCDSAGNIFVLGSQGSSSSRWVVRMSADGGDHWNTVLDVSDGYINFARNVAGDQQGNIWVAGSTSIGSDKYATPRWTVLRHNNNSNTPESWAASWDSRQDSFPGNYSFPVGIAADASGNNVFVTGTVQDWTDGNLNFYPGGRVAVQRLVPTP